MATETISFSSAARRRKADALVTVLLSAQQRGIVLGDLTQWDEDTWRTAASIAGVHVPSNETRQLVVLRIGEGR
jgi:hypothetical protein